MGLESTEASPLHAIFDSAKHFGLTDQEIWWTADECLYELGTDATVLEYLDELAAALARHVLCSQRRTRPGQGQEDPARERPDLSRDRF